MFFSVPLYSQQIYNISSFYKTKIHIYRLINITRRLKRVFKQQNRNHTFMLNSLSIGDQSPNFSGKDQNGKTIQFSDYSGKKLAIFFYPRDLTPTCTTQACNIRDGYAVLQDQGISILGVNDDPEAKHQKFIGKHDLPFPLLADEDKTILNQFGVWGPKKFMGRTFDGTHRTTFLINEEGKIVDIINKVKAKIHTDQILEGFAK